MQFISKLLITEGVFLIIGMVVCHVFKDERKFSGVFVVAGILMILSAIALLLTGLWYLWTL